MPKISELTAETTPADNDLLPIVDISGVITKKITRDDFLTGTPLPNDTVATASIADGAITPAKLQSGTGSTHVWQSWTPTWTNLTPGNATITAKYMQIGKTVHCFIKYVHGSTSTFGTAPTFTAPVTAASQYGTGEYNMVGIGYAADTGITAYNCAFSFNASTTQVSIMSMIVNASWGNYVAVNGTSPFTVGTGDVYNGTFTYEAA